MKIIQAKKHKVGTYGIDKISLSCFDDKRFVLDDKVYTLCYFHDDCNKNKNENNNVNVNNNSVVQMVRLTRQFIIIFIFIKKF